MRLLYRLSSDVVQVNGKQPGAFTLSRSVRQCCLLLHLLYALTSLSQGHGIQSGSMRNRCPSGGGRARVSAYVDQIFIFVSCRNEIKVVQKALKRYEMVTGVKINRNKGLRLGT